MRTKESLFIGILLLSLVGTGMAAVVPDADNLPRDAGAPTLPGGRHDFSKPSKDESPGLDLAPVSTSAAGSGSASGTAKIPGSTAPGGKGGPGSAPGAPSRAEGRDKVKDGLALSSNSAAPPASVMLLGLALLFFVAWAGWKSRQSDQDD